MRPAEPREVGDVCYNSYWNLAYVVLAVTRHEHGGLKSITVLNLSEPNESWARGTVNVKTHCTSWDWRRDLFIDHDVFSLLPEWGYSTYDDFIDEMRDIVTHWIHPTTGRTHD